MFPLPSNEPLVVPAPSWCSQRLRAAPKATPDISIVFYLKTRALPICQKFPTADSFLISEWTHKSRPPRGKTGCAGRKREARLGRAWGEKGGVGERELSMGIAEGWGGGGEGLLAFIWGPEWTCYLLTSMQFCLFRIAWWSRLVCLLNCRHNPGPCIPGKGRTL